MTEWLGAALDDTLRVDWATLILRLVLSLVLGAAVAFIYQGTRRGLDRSPTFPATLVLLSILIAMVTQVIGDNVARAFSLVGALSIVRFRTVVRDTKDTAFVIFAVVVGMAVGAGQTAVALCGLATVGVAATLFRDRPQQHPGGRRPMSLVVRLGWGPDFETLVGNLMTALAVHYELLSVHTVRHGAVVELTYRVGLPAAVTPAQLVGELNRLEGMQAVELSVDQAEAT